LRLETLKAASPKGDMTVTGTAFNDPFSTFDKMSNLQIEANEYPLTP
jgi:hypothetical protein